MGKFFYLLAFFFVLLIFFQKKCNFLCQNFVISKNYTIFVIQSNTELLTYKIYRNENINQGSSREHRLFIFRCGNSGNYF